MGNTLPYIQLGTLPTFGSVHSYIPESRIQVREYPCFPNWDKTKRGEVTWQKTSKQEETEGEIDHRWSWEGAEPEGWEEEGSRS